MALSSLLDYFRLPEATQMQSDLDNPQNIVLIRETIARKPFLMKTYESFYTEMLNKTRTVPFDGRFVELGSGASFLKSYSPYITTSDVIEYEGVDLVFSALDMPFDDQSVSVFLMIDVLHHLKDSRQFFREAKRCLKPNGKIIMIEPANTLWSSFIYRNFHHEPFETQADWGFEEGGPLTGANMAIPWIIFDRDIRLFNEEFPSFRVLHVRRHTPFRYLISGGLSFRQLLPSWFYPLVRGFEILLSPLNRYLGMFMTIEIEKIY
ncbi:MAG: class I SAM-dependent methyltransferase [Elainellaceae cyanobacterium]